MPCPLRRHMPPPLADIQTMMARVGAANTILSINYRQPFVLRQWNGSRRRYPGDVWRFRPCVDGCSATVLIRRVASPLCCLTGRRRPSTLCPARWVFSLTPPFRGFTLCSPFIFRQKVHDDIGHAVAGHPCAVSDHSGVCPVPFASGYTAASCRSSGLSLDRSLRRLRRGV
ncbi:Uncharacterised protein [Edwardsiella ictaluri]|nr:Uncharacterised protein [Edwardsiella ictaluri]